MARILRERLTSPFMTQSSKTHNIISPTFCWSRQGQSSRDQKYCSVHFWKIEHTQTCGVCDPCNPLQLNNFTKGHPCVRPQYCLGLITIFSCCYLNYKFIISPRLSIQFAEGYLLNPVWVNHAYLYQQCFGIFL